MAVKPPVLAFKKDAFSIEIDTGVKLASRPFEYNRQDNLAQEKVNALGPACAHIYQRVKDESNPFVMGVKVVGSKITFNMFPQTTEQYLPTAQRIAREAAKLCLALAWNTPKGAVTETFSRAKCLGNCSTRPIMGFFYFTKPSISIYKQAQKW